MNIQPPINKRLEVNQLHSALTLWHNGYDVWLANHRGTLHSSKHVNLTSWDHQYWNFSFHEMGIYDVSSEVKHIRNKTNDTKIIFMGYSLGSAVGLVYTSMVSEEAKAYLKSMILVAPPAYFKHSPNVLKFFNNFRSALHVIDGYLHMGNPIFFLPLLLSLFRFMFRLFPFLPLVVSTVVWILCGYTPTETDPALFTFDLATYFNTFSTKTVLHFAQNFETDNQFQMYDYGTEENLKFYGSVKPSLYPLEKISVPSLLIASSEDNLITVEDCKILFERLPPKAKIYEYWTFPGWNHVDAILGKNRKVFIDKLLHFLNQETSK